MSVLLTPAFNDLGRLQVKIALCQLEVSENKEQNIAGAVAAVKVGEYGAFKFADYCNSMYEVKKPQFSLWLSTPWQSAVSRLLPGACRKPRQLELSWWSYQKCGIAPTQTPHSQPMPRMWMPVMRHQHRHWQQLLETVGLRLWVAQSQNGAMAISTTLVLCLISMAIFWQSTAR